MRTKKAEFAKSAECLLDEWMEQERQERLTAEHKTKIIFVQTIKGFALIDLDLADGTPRCLLTVCVCLLD